MNRIKISLDHWERAMKSSVEIDDLPPCVVNHLLCDLVESAYCRLLNFVYNIGPKGNF